MGCSSCTPHPVYVGLGGLGNIEIHHKINILYVNASGYNIGGYQYSFFMGLKGLQCLLAFALFEV